MKYYLLTIVFLLSTIRTISCQERNDTLNRKIDKQKITNCCNYLTPFIEIWSHTGKDFIIGDWGEREDSYVQSHGWNSTDYPFPKKFDCKIVIFNNPLLYENPKPIGKWHITLDLKFKVGETENGTYILNPNIVGKCNIFNKMVISDESFSEGSRIELWKYNIELEKFYNKFKKENLFINQLVFEIRFNKGEYKCFYEYIFPMVGEQEP